MSRFSAFCLDSFIFVNFRPNREQLGLTCNHRPSDRNLTCDYLSLETSTHKSSSTVSSTEHASVCKPMGVLLNRPGCENSRTYVPEPRQYCGQILLCFQSRTTELLLCTYLHMTIPSPRYSIPSFSWYVSAMSYHET
jgi:hypothetical protein